MTSLKLACIAAGGLIAATLLPGSIPALRAQDAEAGLGLTVDNMKEQLAFAIAKDAYIYAYPLVTMEMTRRVMTNAAEPAGKNAPMGQLASMRDYPSASFRDVTAPNADTLYTVGWIDVSKEPSVLSLPEENGRYYLFPMLSAWTDVIADPGKRTTGTGPQNYAITGPNWNGTLPDGVQQIKSPTNIVWLLGRTYCTGTPEDYKAVHAIQDNYKLTPLSSYGKPYTPPRGTPNPDVDMKTPVRDQVNQMDAATFFKTAAALMKDNPPAAADAPIVAWISKIGLAPGRNFDIGRFGPAVARGIARAPKAALEEIGSHVKDVGKVENGWVVAANMGRYGTDYLQRAAITMVGLGANRPRDAVYPLTSVDSHGAKLNGANKYTIHFDKDKFPPVNGFWSLTMYDDKMFFVPNALNRYTLSERNKFNKNADGSVDLFLQNESPGQDKEANWLPAPKGDMNLILRLYWPKDTPPSILDGSWKPPKVEQAIPAQAGASPGTDGTLPSTSRAALPPTPAGTRPEPMLRVRPVEGVLSNVQVIDKGWSAGRFLGQTVYNGEGDQVGFVRDLLIAPDRTVSYVILGTRGDFNFQERNVAFPISLFKTERGEVMLPNVTEDSIASMPEFVYGSSDFASANAE